MDDCFCADGDGVGSLEDGCVCDCGSWVGGYWGSGGGGCGGAVLGVGVGMGGRGFEVLGGSLHFVSLFLLGWMRGNGDGDGGGGVVVSCCVDGAERRLRSRRRIE